MQNDTHQLTQHGQRAPQLRHSLYHRIVPLLFSVIFLLGGCSTHLGYVPHDVYAPCFRPHILGWNCQAENPSSTSPLYEEVKAWSYEVADGYDTRATLNRQALYGGGLVALAGTSALVGLAAFAPGSAAIIGIPVGTTFLSGTMALYHHEQKAVIYGLASQTIRDVMIRSDGRLSQSVHKKETEAVCLHAEVSDVMKKVNSHITLLDPQNVADRLKAVASSIETKEARAAHLKNLADKAEADAKKDASLQKAATTARENADKAKADADKEKAEKTVEALAKEAYDFDDLKTLPEVHGCHPQPSE